MCCSIPAAWISRPPACASVQRCACIAWSQFRHRSFNAKWVCCLPTSKRRSTNVCGYFSRFEGSSPNHRNTKDPSVTACNKCSWTPTSTTTGSRSSTLTSPNLARRASRCCDCGGWGVWHKEVAISGEADRQVLMSKGWLIADFRFLDVFNELPRKSSSALAATPATSQAGRQNWGCINLWQECKP